MTIKDTQPKYLLITAVIMLVLQGANLVGVAINTKDIKENSDKINFVSKDYVPMWFLEGLQKNNDYKTEEIIAVIKGDEVNVKEINAKYIDFQKTMLNNMASMRGGYSQVTRGVNK
jgi:hypothetical protein